MAYPTKIGGETEPNCIKKGNLWLGVGGRNYGPTNQTGFYATLPPPEDGYTVLIEKASGGPAVYNCANDSDLIGVINGAEAQSFSTLKQVLNYAAENDIAVVNKIEPEIVTDELIFNVEASSLLSYPTTESVCYDISKEQSTGTFQNEVTFENSSSFNFDGSDSYISLSGLTITGQMNKSYNAVVKLSEDFNSRGGVIAGRHNTSNFFGITSGRQITAGEDDWFITGDTQITTDTWAHISYTFELNEQAATQSLYINGELDATRLDYGYNDAYSESTQNIGRDHRFFYYFNGNISSVKAYNKTLSQSEINQNYYGGPIVTDGLVWAIDASNLVSYESGSGTTYALTGSRDGTLLNGTAYSSNNGGTFEFDGIDDYITFGSADQILSDTYFTIECWMKSSDDGTGAGSSAGFVGTRVGRNAMLCRNGLGNRAMFYWDTTTEGNINLDSNTVVFDEKWHHIVGTFDNGLGKIYVDGEFKNSTSSTAPIDLNDAAFGMGADPNNLSRTFYGQVPIGRVYNRVLTAEEVQQNYLAQWGRFT
jgi:hypothetical protein